MVTRKKATKKTVVETQAAVDAVSGLEPNKVITEIGSLQVELQDTLASLGATITSKLALVGQVDTAIKAKQTELQELYDIEREALALEDVRARREAEEVEWEKRNAERDIAWRDSEQLRQKQWTREEEEHQYAVGRRNERAEADYRVLVDRHQRDEAIRVESLERKWNERAAALKAQEDEVTGLREQVAKIDERIKAEVARAEAIVGNTLKRQHEHELVMLKKDSESAKALHAAEIQSLKNTISSLSDQIEHLQGELAKSREYAQTVTTQALDSASQRQVATALSKVVDNQGSQTKGK